MLFSFDLLVIGGPLTGKSNENNIWFPRDEDRKIDVKTGKHDMNNQPKKAIFNYEQEGRLCLGVAESESKNGPITGKQCPIFDYSGGKIVTIDAYKNKHRNNLQEFESLLPHCHNG